MARPRASRSRWFHGVVALQKETTYFGPGTPAFMLNCRVDDLDGLIARLRAEGVEISDERHQDENGRFAWITDPEGNRIELWEPAPGH